MTKKRNPLVAALFSLILPGLGHVYVGQARQGLILFGLQYLMLLLAGWLDIFSTFNGLVLFVVLIAGLYLYTLFSAVWLALNAKHYELKGINRWYWYVALLLAAMVLANGLAQIRDEVFGYRSYKISDQSMLPSLLPGDLIMVNTRYREPKVGDLVVFHKQRFPYIKRVTALADDRVMISNGELLRNGKLEASLLVAKHYRREEFSIAMPQKKVPAGEMFLLGDWRDKSDDSRFFGSIPLTDLIGKVDYIFYSNDWDRVGKVLEPQINQEKIETPQE